MRLALLFSGQGQQTPDHLHALEAGATPQLNTQLATLLPGVWHNPAVCCEVLQKNLIAQPFIFAFQMQCWQQLQALLPRPICVAGYSLGELAACCAAGAFDITQGIMLATHRAASMDACVQSEAGLLSVMGLSQQDIELIAAESHTHLAISNPGQHYIIGGLDPSLHHASELAQERGAMRVIRLGVRTPSHTPLLQSATQTFERFLLPYRNPRPLAFKVLSAIDGRGAFTTERALVALASQISQAMNWQACLQATRELQPDAVLEIGPGRALARMWEASYPDIPARSTDDFRSTGGIKTWIENLNLR